MCIPSSKVKLLDQATAIAMIFLFAVMPCCNLAQDQAAASSSADSILSSHLTKRRERKVSSTEEMIHGVLTATPHTPIGRFDSLDAYMHS
jgi:hypothetical protein